MKTVNITSIPPDKTVEITIGGLFYQRLNTLLIHYADSVDTKELTKHLLDIKNDKVEPGGYGYDLETLMVLLRDIEQKFVDAGHAVQNDIDLDFPEELTVSD